MSNKDILPVFIFSMPRSGSTLLQRVLAESSNIATAAEPWFLLHLMYMMRVEGIYTEYKQAGAVQAYSEFLGSNFDALVRDFAHSAYRSRATENELFFLDKTPRYCYIINDLIRCFPSSKRIYLVRNPVAVIDSIISTWGNGRWIIRKFENDLTIGLNNLVAGARDDQESITLTFENLTSDSHHESIVISICNYIGIDVCLSVSRRYDSDIPGAMGDPNRYQKTAIEQKNDSMVGSSINNIYRYWWLKRYWRNLEGATREFLVEQYNFNPLNYKPNTIRFHSAALDFMLYSYHFLIEEFEGSNFKARISRFLK